MSAKAISEADGKRLLATHLPEDCPGKSNIRIASYGPNNDWENIVNAHPFLKEQASYTCSH